VIIGINAIDMTVRSESDASGILGQLAAQRLPVQRLPVQPVAHDGNDPSERSAWAISNLILNVEVDQELDNRPAAPKVHEAGITHICLQARDAPTLKAELEGADISFNADLITLGNGTWYAYGHTPSGFVVEVESAEYAPEDAPKAWLSHVALCTHNLEALAEFYAKLTGRPWFGGYRVKQNPANDRITGLDDVDLKVCWVACGNIMLEFWQYLNPETQRRTPSVNQKSAGLNTLTFELDDLRQALPHLIEAGVTFGDNTIQEHPTGLLIEGTDPDGNALAFVSFDKTQNDPRSLHHRSDFGWMPRLGDLRATLTTSSFRPRFQW
jgi:Glyoxalase/Bleomycin resistance protein/Dioxygenase superfamily